LVAAISCGMQGETEHVVRIWGSEGHIVVPAPWKPSQRDARLLVHKRGRPAAEEILIQTPVPLYAHEADRVARAIRAGDHEVRPPGMSWADTLGNMAALDAWRAAVGLTFVSEGR
jgi:predicted dehydrogenase